MTLAELIKLHGAATVATAIGISRAHATHLANGTRNPSGRVLARAAEYFGEKMNLRKTLASHHATR